MQINMSGDAVFQPALNALTQLQPISTAASRVQQSTIGQIQTACPH